MQNWDWAPGWSWPRAQRRCQDGGVGCSLFSPPSDPCHWASQYRQVNRWRSSNELWKTCADCLPVDAFTRLGMFYSYLIHTEAIWSSSARRTDLSSQRNAGNWQFLAIPQGSDRFDPFIPSLMFETHFFPDVRMRNIQPGIDLKKMTLGIPEKDLPFSRLLREAISVMCSTCHLRV